MEANTRSSQDVQQLKEGVIKESLQNTLINIDTLERRIFADLQRFRSDIKAVLATL